MWFGFSSLPVHTAVAAVAENRAVLSLRRCIMTASVMTQQANEGPAARFAALFHVLQTLMHVYEARCTACSGSGWARAPSNGRRGHLCTCMVCHGLGKAGLLLLT